MVLISLLVIWWVIVLRFVSMCWERKLWNLVRKFCFGVRLIFCVDVCEVILCRNVMIWYLLFVM